MQALQFHLYGKTMDFVQVEGRSFFDLSLLTLGVGNVDVRFGFVLAIEVAVS